MEDTLDHGDPGPCGATKEILSDEHPPPRLRRHQWIAVLLANLAAVCGGTALSWSAPALPVLQGAEDTGGWAGAWTRLLQPSVPLTEEEGALVASLVPLGALVGALPAGWVGRRAGSRRPLFSLAVLFIIGWVLILFARPAGLTALLLGRALHGVATGAATVLVARYSDEVAEVAVRGTLGALLDFSLCNGALLVYALALALPYALLTAASACVPVIFALSFFSVPESPVFLARRGRREEALEALAWLRPGWGPRALSDELRELLAEEPSSSPQPPRASTDAPPPSYEDVASPPAYEMVVFSQTVTAMETIAEACIVDTRTQYRPQSEDPPLPVTEVLEAQVPQPVVTPPVTPPEHQTVTEPAENAAPTTCSQRLLDLAVASPPSAKAVFITYSLMFLQQAAAISAVMAYATQMFTEAGGTLSPALSTVVLGALQSLAGGAAVLIVERVGRRTLLVVSATAAGAALAVMAAVDISAAPWLPPVALGAYIFAFEIGLGPLPWFITAELVGPAASGGAVALNWATAAAVTELYPKLAKNWGQRAVFAAFAAMAGAAASFSLVCVPETRGKTRAQLRSELKSWPRRSSPRPPNDS